jgi:hypothetical protein
MKNFRLIFSTTILILTACGTTKSLQKVTGSTEIKVPLEGKEYTTNSEVFRAKNYGKSPDLATAKKIALLNAKSELASNINSIIKKVAEQYINQRTVGNAQEYESKFEENTREVVNQTLKDVVIIGEKIFKETDGSFTYWIAIETNKAGILEGINQKISKNESLKLEYDKVKFEQIYNAEMIKTE